MAPLRAAFTKPSYLTDEEHPNRSVLPPLEPNRQNIENTEQPTEQSPSTTVSQDGENLVMDAQQSVSEPTPGTSNQLVETSLSERIQRGYCIHDTNLLNCLTCFRRVKREFYIRWPNSVAERFFDNLSGFYDAAVTVFGTHLQNKSIAIPLLPTTCTTETQLAPSSTRIYRDPVSYPGTSETSLPAPIQSDSQYEDISDDELVIDDLPAANLPPPPSPLLQLPTFDPNEDIWDDILALVSNDPIMNRAQQPSQNVPQDASTQTINDPTLPLLE